LQRLEALEAAESSKRALQQTYDELRLLTRRLEAAKEDERKHIARELHDEMGQALTAAKINVQLMPLGDDAARQRRVGEVVGLIDGMIRHVRQLSLDLRPPLLDELGLETALRGYLDAVTRTSGVAIGLEVEGLRGRLPPEQEIAAFRVAQEAVTNVLRHASASRVDVRLRADGQWLRIDVDDDGQGFDPADALEGPEAGGHVGLRGMRERMRALGGDTVFESVPGRGTRVRAWMPLGAAEAGDADPAGG